MTSSVSSGIPADINPGIRKLVALLRGAGFNTVDSGDGETHMYGCDRKYGYVSIRVDAAEMVDEAHRLLQTLLSVGIPVREPLTESDECPCIQAIYGPVSGIAILDVERVHDRMLYERGP